MNDCLFCRIIAKEIPSTAIYEDENVYAFLDINPVNPGHTLVVPKVHSDGFHDASPETLEALVRATQKVANAIVASGLCEAFNLEENNGKAAGQVIPHLHLHIVPRRVDDKLGHWPGTPYVDDQEATVASKIRASLDA